MRKVLLATTALVALGGVSAASADITVSGSASFNYISGSGDGFSTDSSDYNNTVDMKISASTTMDNGMSAAGFIAFDESNDVDDSGWSLTGDFGTIAFGGSASGTMGAMATDVTADEGNGFATGDDYAAFLPGDEDIAASDVSLALPAISGLSIMLGVTDGDTDDNDGTAAGLSYAMDAGSMGVTIAYAMSGSGAGNDDATNTAAKITAGDMAVTVMRGTLETSATDKYTMSSIGATYTVSDSLSVAAYTGSTDLNSNSSYEVKDTGVGLTYTITGGMSVSVTHNDFSGKNGTAADAKSGTRTAVALDVTF